MREPGGGAGFNSRVSPPGITIWSNMIIETKEQLAAQLSETWDKLMEIDTVLEDAADEIARVHKNVRRMIQQHNEQTTVRGTNGVATPRELLTGSQIEDSAVHRVSDAPREYTLRSRRDPSRK